MLFVISVTVLIYLAVQYFQCLFQVGKNSIISTTRVHNTMVHNPIYDGPLYDSIQPKFETLTSGRSLVYTPTKSVPRSNSLSTARYVDQPTHVLDPSNDKCNSQSTSAFKPSGVIALKKDGQECSKLQLALSFDLDDTTCAAEQEIVSVPKSVPKSVPQECVNPVPLLGLEEGYTAMSPAGTLLTSMKAEM